MSGHSRSNSTVTNVVLFDGRCEVCRASIFFLRRRLAATPAIVAHQDVTNAQLAVWGLTRRDVARSVWWINGRHQWAGHVAVGHLLLRSHRSWPLVGALVLWSPLRPVAGVAYRLFARSRPWLPGWVSRQHSR